MKMEFENPEELKKLNPAERKTIEVALLETVKNVYQYLSLKEKPHLCIFESPEDGRNIIIIYLKVKHTIDVAWKKYEQMMDEWWIECPLSGMITLSMTNYDE